MAVLLGETDFVEMIYPRLQRDSELRADQATELEGMVVAGLVSNLRLGPMTPWISPAAWR